jgi:hypothetical protein
VLPGTIVSRWSKQSKGQRRWRRAVPEAAERSRAVFAVVHEDDHAVGVHGLSGVELPVLEGTDDLLGESLGTSLELLDLFLRGVSGLHLLLDGLHVLLEVAEVGLLVEGGLVEAEVVDNVDDGGGGILSALVATILSRGVGTDVWRIGSQHLGWLRKMLEGSRQAYRCCHHQW